MFTARWIKRIIDHYKQHGKYPSDSWVGFWIGFDAGRVEMANWMKENHFQSDEAATIFIISKLKGSAAKIIKKRQIKHT